MNAKTEWNLGQIITILISNEIAFSQLLSMWHSQYERLHQLQMPPRSQIEAFFTHRLPISTSIAFRQTGFIIEIHVIWTQLLFGLLQNSMVWWREREREKTSWFQMTLITWIASSTNEAKNLTNEVQMCLWRDWIFAWFACRCAKYHKWFFVSFRLKRWAELSSSITRQSNSRWLIKTNQRGFFFVWHKTQNCHKHHHNSVAENQTTRRRIRKQLTRKREREARNNIWHWNLG